MKDDVVMAYTPDQYFVKAGALEERVKLCEENFTKWLESYREDSRKANRAIFNDFQDALTRAMAQVQKRIDESGSLMAMEIKGMLDGNEEIGNRLNAAATLVASGLSIQDAVRVVGELKKALKGKS